MRVAFIGCVNYSYQMLDCLLSLQDVDVVGVVTREKSAFNSDFRNLAPLAERAGIPCFLARRNKQDDMAFWLAALRPDVIYCFGWSYLLSPEILQVARLGVVGYHPSPLPQNRGRHPIVWTLALGLKETASSFFFMDEGADAGDILSQVPVVISPDDDAGSLYGKLVDTSKQQLSLFTAQLVRGDFTRKMQEEKLANTWRKRTKEDGQIDWRMSARSICNLVRALTRPYPGAHCRYLEEERRVWKANCLPLAGAHANIEPGKVLEVDSSSLTVKAGEDAVVLIEHELVPAPEVGAYL